MYERLTTIAEWLDGCLDPFGDLKAAEVRAMAEECRGAVVAKARVVEEPPRLHILGRYAACIVAVGRGNTPEEAMAALQRELDKT